MRAFKTRDGDTLEIGTSQTAEGKLLVLQLSEEATGATVIATFTPRQATLIRNALVQLLD